MSPSDFTKPPEHANASSGTHSARMSGIFFSGEITGYFSGGCVTESTAAPAQACLNSFRRFRANAIDYFQTPALDKFTQVVQRCDLEFLMQRGCSLRANARKLQQIQHGCRRLCG